MSSEISNFSFEKQSESKDRQKEDGSQTVDLFLERENEKEIFQSELKKILDIELTPGNINSFMNQSLNELADLANKITFAYCAVNTSSSNITPAGMEDVAFEYFGLSNIPQLLDIIGQKSEILQKIDNFVNENIIILNSVHTPADEQEMLEDEGAFEDKKKRQRLKTLLYILIRDFNYDLESGGISLIAGTNLSTMVRDETYVSVDIPELERLVEINDGVGNRTFIYDTRQLKKLKKSPQDLRAMTKSKKREWLEENPGTGKSFIERGKWRDLLSFYLSNNGKKEFIETIVSKRYASFQHQSSELKGLLGISRLKSNRGRI